MTLLADEIDLDSGNSIFATCSASESVGDFVFVSGSGPAVSKVDPLVQAKMPTVGVIISKSSTTDCVVQISGVAEGIATGLTPGALHWIGLDGKIAAAGPTPSFGSFVYKQRVGPAASSTSVFLSLGEPYKLVG